MRAPVCKRSARSPVKTVTSSGRGRDRILKSKRRPGLAPSLVLAQIEPDARAHSFTVESRKHLRLLLKTESQQADARTRPHTSDRVDIGERQALSTRRGIVALMKAADIMG